MRCVCFGVSHTNRVQFDPLLNRLVNQVYVRHYHWYESMRRVHRTTPFGVQLKKEILDGVKLINQKMVLCTPVGVPGFDEYKVDKTNARIAASNDKLVQLAELAHGENMIKVSSSCFLRCAC